jgi:protein SCO1/2
MTFLPASLRVALIVILSALAVCPAGAQVSGPSLYERQDASQPAANRLPALLMDVGIDQKLGTTIPLDLPFKDEQGRSVILRDYFGKRPVILTLVYFECPMLCTQVLNGLTSAIGVLKFNVGQEFDIVTISFNPKETPDLAQAKKTSYLGRYKREGAGNGWHFLTGTQHSIESLTGRVGFRYAYNPSAGQYAHASGIMVLTPDGKLSRYFFGIDYAPRDVQLALIEASDRRIGSLIDQLPLFCFHYDPAQARYTFTIMRLVRGAGLFTVVAIVAGIVVLRRRERRPLGRA